MTIFKTDYFGASVRGPLHSDEKLPNEDAWLGASGAFGTLIVVCDGLGSRPDAHLGAKMACLAVRDAISYWTRSGESHMDYLISLIHIMWKMRIFPKEPEDCATTCLWALKHRDGRLTVAGIGDGMILLKQKGFPVSRFLSRNRGDFSNQTQALGFSKKIGAWTYETMEHADNTSVILTTDGVSDDLLDEHLDAFVKWLLDEFCPMNPRERWRKLCHELRNWPTPNHLDDKTLAVLNSFPVNEGVIG